MVLAVSSPYPQKYLIAAEDRAAFERWCNGTTGYPIIDVRRHAPPPPLLLSVRVWGCFWGTSRVLPDGLPGF